VSPLSVKGQVAANCEPDLIHERVVVSVLAASWAIVASRLVLARVGDNVVGDAGAGRVADLGGQGPGFAGQ
jgi:hypothetical protein